MESNTPETALPVTESEAPLPVENAHDIPYWHTAVLVLVLGVLSVGNAKSAHGTLSAHSLLRIYLATSPTSGSHGVHLVGVRRAGGTMRELIGGRWQRVEDFFSMSQLRSAHGSAPCW